MATLFFPPLAGTRARVSAAADDWGALMVAGQAGDARAYRRLLGEVALWLKRFYARRLPPAVVDDAVQDTLIAVHEKRHTYDPTRPFRPWLAAVARYKWVDRLRAMARSRTEPLAAEIAVGDHGAGVASAIVLDKLLDRLKPAQRDAIRLVKLLGHSVEETSVITGQSVPLVKVNIHRGLSRLAAYVQEAQDDD